MTQSPEAALETLVPHLGPTTEDAFLGGRVTMIQPARGYRAGVDAVLLAACVPALRGHTVLEAGAGVGVPLLCIAERVPGTRLTAVEVQSELCVVGRANAARNGVSDRLEFVEADILGPSAALAEAGLVRETADHVLANPPFQVAGRARAAHDPGKARSHMLERGELDGWIRFMVTMAAPDATVTVIHRADALPELLALMGPRVGNIAVLPIHPKPGGEAIRILLQGRKGSHAPVRILPGFILHAPDGGFTPEAEQILRHGTAIELG